MAHDRKNAPINSGKSLPVIRCAIYTRKSTEEGLEQDFNSLDAQREASQAFITSQKHEGWTAVRERYDDGGFSGGNMERPALKRLLADIAAGKINVVVVYKVDRLTRSLSDFAKIIDTFDKIGASFVSVTQQFNTTSSMGRLTLNVLLSFAQFEREVTAERIRDKIAASRAKGMWMGGAVPFGYDAVEKKLVINQKDAEMVRRLYQRYLELGSVPALKAELDRQGVRSKKRELKNGRYTGGCSFSHGALRTLLTNTVYIGQARHKKVCHPGQHEALVDKELWDAVQQRMDQNRVDRRDRPAGYETSPLAGKLFDEAGGGLTPSHANTRGRRYRYYISQSLTTGTAAQANGGWRVPAREIEEAVAAAACKILSDRPAIADAVRTAGIDDRHISQIILAAANVVEQLKSPTEQGAALRQFVTRVEIGIEQLTVSLSLEPLLSGAVKASVKHPDALSLMRHDPLKFKRRGQEMRLVIEPAGFLPPAKADQALLKAVARARQWFHELATGKEKSITKIAEREELHPRYVNRIIPLAFLSPDIVESILEGRQPPDMTLHSLTFGPPLPYDWGEQGHTFL